MCIYLSFIPRTYAAKMDGPAFLLGELEKREGEGDAEIVREKFGPSYSRSYYFWRSEDYRVLIFPAAYLRKRYVCLDVDFLIVKRKIDN